MNANKLIEECDTHVHSLNFRQQFNYSFKHYRDFIQPKLNEQIDKEEIESFIKVCDNRIDYAKTFFQNAAALFGYSIAGLAIVLTISGLERDKSHADVFLDSLIRYLGNIILPIMVFSLIALIVYFIKKLIYGRANIRAWAAFKEGAILKKNCEEK